MSPHANPGSPPATPGIWRVSLAALLLIVLGTVAVCWNAGVRPDVQHGTRYVSRHFSKLKLHHALPATPHATTQRQQQQQQQQREGEENWDAQDTLPAGTCAAARSARGIHIFAGTNATALLGPRLRANDTSLTLGGTEPGHGHLCVQIPSGRLPGTYLRPSPVATPNKVLFV